MCAGRCGYFVSERSDLFRISNPAVVDGKNIDRRTPLRIAMARIYFLFYVPSTCISTHTSTAYQKKTSFALRRNK